MTRKQLIIVHNARNTDIISHIHEVDSKPSVTVCGQIKSSSVNYSVVQCTYSQYYITGQIQVDWLFLSWYNDLLYNLIRLYFILIIKSLGRLATCSSGQKGAMLWSTIKQSMQIKRLLITNSFYATTYSYATARFIWDLETLKLDPSEN